MVVSCEISFDQNTLGTYFSGQIISGKVTLKSDKPKEVKCILLKVLGYAKTQWSERHFNRRRQYVGREDYLSTSTYILGSEQNDKYTIESGTHTYTFCCQLPYNCPSSFEGTYGSVRYLVKVTLIRPWKFDQTYTKGFTVLKTVDLNFETPQIKIPSKTEVYKVLCCGPCKTDPLKMELNLQQSGFVPGQMIPFSVLIINNTSYAVAELVFSLVMNVRYHSKYPNRQSCVESIVIAKAKGEKVLRNCTRLLHHEFLIPATPPTCLQFCHIIQIAYQVEVEAKFNGCHANQVIGLPVVIGNVPLWNTVIEQQPTRVTSKNDQSTLVHLTANPYESSAQEANEATNEIDHNHRTSTAATIPTAPMTTPTDIYPNMPPPSYQQSSFRESVNINEDELHTFGPSVFTPLYPVYNIPNINKCHDDICNERNNAFVNQSFQH